VSDMEGEGGGRKKHTSTGPGNRTCSQARGTILVDLEPHRALAVKRRGSLARGDLGEVELQRARVTDVGIDVEADVASCGDCQSLGSRCAWCELVAGHLCGGDIADWSVRVSVLGEADGFPLARLGSVVDGSCEGVW